MEQKTGELGAILQANDYPGRGIVLGLSADGKKAALAYFIMGRSENSRNRIFAESGGTLTIYPFDAARVSDPSLIIYSPVRVLGAKTIVTNGDQTDTVFDYLQKGASFDAALATRCFEPDAPNYTPRISGLIDLENGFSYQMSILKAADAAGNGCSRFSFSYAPVAGVGHLIHTYAQNGDPLPSFFGEPTPVMIGMNLDAFTHCIWENLNSDNKISLYTRFIDLKSGTCESRLINKNV